MSDNTIHTCPDCGGEKTLRQLVTDIATEARAASEAIDIVHLAGCILTVRPVEPANAAFYAAVVEDFIVLVLDQFDSGR
jgi:predicted metal-binding protein